MEVELIGYNDGKPKVDILEDGTTISYGTPENVLQVGEKDIIVNKDNIPEVNLDDAALEHRGYPILQHPLVPDEQYLYDYGISCQWAIVHSSYDFTNKEYRLPIVKWVYEEPYPKQKPQWDDEIEIVNTNGK